MPPGIQCDISDDIDVTTCGGAARVAPLPRQNMPEVRLKACG